MKPPIYRTPDQIPIGTSSLAEFLWELRHQPRSNGSRRPIPAGTDLSFTLLEGVDFGGAELAGVNLDHADLKSADLAGICCTGAKLRGTRLDRANLRGARLIGTKLELASLEGADLRQACFENADLRGARLCGADARGAKFTSADLSGAVLRSADLRDSDNASERTCVGNVNLSGADLLDARLPAALDLSGAVAGLQEIAAATLNMLLLFAAGVFYCLIMAITSTDDKLLPNAATLPLPFLQTAVLIEPFFLLAPTALLLSLCYVQPHLLRFLATAARLPAVFPDGSPIHEKVRPWLLSALLGRLMIGSSDRQTTTKRLMQLMLDATWYAASVVIFFYWFRFLVLHSALNNLLIEALGLASLAASMWFQSHGLAFFRPERIRRLVLRQAVVLAGVAAVTTFFSLASAGHTLDRLIAPDFEKRDVTVRPEKLDPEKPAELRGAALANSNLRYANARYAFLVHADFKDADLSFAQMQGADLRAAHFDKTMLPGVSFDGANLFQAKFDYAVFAHYPCEDPSRSKTGVTTFNNADLTGAAFKQPAQLCGASLAGAQLDGTSLIHAVLNGANLTKAEARQKPVILEVAQLEGAVLEEAELPAANLKEAYLKDAHLRKADLSRADLTGAKLIHTDLRLSSLNGANLTGAKLDCPRAEGADLRDAILTADQLRHMTIDDATKLSQPRPETSGCEAAK
jgi:uncharacterized protein YjbI with pentapeptide repeats